MVDEGPGSRSLQHVVQVVLEPPVAHVPAPALRAVYERFAEQAEPGSLLPSRTVGTGGADGVAGREQAVSRAVHHLPPGFDIFHAVAFGAVVARRGPHPEPGGAFISAVFPWHGITEADFKMREGVVWQRRAQSRLRVGRTARNETVDRARRSRLPSRFDDRPPLFPRASRAPTTRNRAPPPTRILPSLTKVIKLPLTSSRRVCVNSNQGRDFGVDIALAPMFCALVSDWKMRDQAHPN